MNAQQKAQAAVSADELQALRAYAAQHGRTWKDSLRTAWYNASEPGHLQVLRNRLGPGWLIAFQFPEGQS